MTSDNITVLNDSYNLAQSTVSIYDIMGSYNEMYINLIFLSSIILLLYVIWMNFFINSKYQKLLEVNGIDIHELAILPAILLVIVTLSYKGMI